MFRVRHIVASVVIAMAPALAGCAGSSLTSYIPDWMRGGPSAPPTQALQFESEPPGADVNTTSGQTCITPCSLAVPVTNQAVTFALRGYEPQTIQVATTETGQLMPNPVTVTFQPLSPPPPVRKPRKPPPKTAAKKPVPVPPPPPPPQTSTQPPPASPFPPPPSH